MNTLLFCNSLDICKNQLEWSHLFWPVMATPAIHYFSVEQEQIPACLSSLLVAVVAGWIL